MFRAPEPERETFVCSPGLGIGKEWKVRRFWVGYPQTMERDPREGYVSCPTLYRKPFMTFYDIANHVPRIDATVNGQHRVLVVCYEETP